MNGGIGALYQPYSLSKFILDGSLRKWECSLSRKEPRPCLPVSSTLLQAIKRKSLKKASIPQLQILSSALISVLSAAQCVSDAHLHSTLFFFLSITLKRPFTNRTLTWKVDIYKKEKKIYRAWRSNIYGVQAHAFSINTWMHFFFKLNAFNATLTSQCWLYVLSLWREFLFFA